jgi:hypothetical protein
LLLGDLSQQRGFVSLYENLGRGVVRIRPRAQIRPHLFRIRRRFPGPQPDEGVGVAALLGLLHLPVYGEDLVLRPLRQAPERANQETDKSPHLLDDIGWISALLYSSKKCRLDGSGQAPGDTVLVMTERLSSASMTGRNS